MKVDKLCVIVILMGLLCAPMATAQERADGDEKVGQVHFPISCGTEAQQQFSRSLAVLHSFWYAEALKGFTTLTETDSDCAMGYWGIAMSHWHPLWRPPDSITLSKGWAAVQKAKSVGGRTDREKAYIAAIEEFYRDSDKLDHPTRALAYEKAMEQLFLRYPEDREAAVFYSLALNATAAPTDKTYANQLKAGEILESVFEKEPEHPGVAHYLIHSYDYPPLAKRALDAARRYAEIAPSVPHALHMPSHIFTRLGIWQESIESNRASALSAKEHRSVFEQLHALDYLAYAHLQVSQDREASRVFDECNILNKNVGSSHFTSVYAFAAIPARYTLERRRWAEAASLTPAESRNNWSEAITYFARAIGSARSGDVASAQKDVDKLQSLRDALAEANQNYWADEVEIQRRAAAAWLAYAKGKNQDALKLMRAAADLEDSSEKHPVTPGQVVPARELLGEMLLELLKPGQALIEFETSLQDSPNRFNGIYGAARAAELSGDREKARDFYDKLVALCEHADSERPELLEAKAFLAKMEE